ncbi:MAG TPA: hypothetical protein VGD94_00375 [Vicinamibacterales bacterium]
MTIKSSHASEIRALIESLESENAVDRDVAVARLAVLGERAVDRLIAAYSRVEREARVGVLRALEAIADPRALRVARSGLDQGGEVAAAATGTLRALLDSPDEDAAAGALDALVGAALDPSRERRVRVAAFEALRGMPADVLEPVSAAIRQLPGAQPSETEQTELDAVWQDAIDGRLPDDPSILRDAVAARAAAAPLGTLQGLIEACRVREQDSPANAVRAGWLTVRGALHQALALRGSRVALYDLRETLEGAKGPLPTTFTTAVHAIGDESCLEGIAAAWSAAEGDASAAWRQQLRAAFDAIVKREKLTKRSAVMKKIVARWPGWGG